MRNVDSQARPGAVLEIHDAVQIGPRDAADFLHRHPVLGKLDALLRPEKSIRLLIAEQAGLHFHIGAVVVR